MKAASSSILFISSTADNLYSQDRAGVIKLWDLEKSGYVLKKEIVTGHLGFTRAQHIADQNLLVAPSGNSDIVFIDLVSGTEVQTLKPPSEDIQQITGIKIIPWHNDDTYILASFESGHLVLFDIKQSKAVTTLKYNFGISCFDYDLTSNRGLVSGPSNISVCVFGIDRPSLELYRKDAENIEYMANDGEKLAGISVIKFRPDRKIVIVGTCDGIVYIHSHKSLRKFATLRNHKGEITDVAFSNGAIDNFKSPIMAVIGTDGNISLWDIYYK